MMKDKDTVQVSLAEIYDKGYKAGIREVTDWIENQRVAGFTLIEGIGQGIPISEEKWQAQLKEWGIDG